jgi:hypothetical protein
LLNTEPNFHLELVAARLSLVFRLHGAYTMGGLIFDSSGNLDGTAAGGTHDGGVVFEIVP